MSELRFAACGMRRNNECLTLNSVIPPLRPARFDKREPERCPVMRERFRVCFGCYFHGHVSAPGLLSAAP